MTIAKLLWEQERWLLLALAITTQGSNATNATGAIVAPPSNNLDIRPFRVNVPEAELTEMHRRVSSTR